MFERMRTMPRAEYEPHLLEVLHVESQRDEIVRGLLGGNARPAA